MFRIFMEPYLILLEVWAGVVVRVVHIGPAHQRAVERVEVGVGRAAARRVGLVVGARARAVVRRAGEVLAQPVAM